MSLEQSFRRLALQPSSICHHCRRAFTSSARPQQQQSAIDELLQSSKNEEAAKQRNRSPLTRPADPSQNDGSSAMFNLARQTVLQSSAARREAQRDQNLAEMSTVAYRKDLENQIPRRWRLGDVYAPHDLSGVEMGKWKKLRRKPGVGSHGKDVLDHLGIDPREHYKNFSMMAEYVTEMGRIKHSRETGLRPVNQRRMAKAVRRAIGTGLMPSVYKHPELIRGDLEARNPRQ